MQVCIATLLAVAAPVHSSLPTPSPSTLLETAPAPVGQEANDTQFFLSDVFSPLLPEGFSPLLLPLSLEGKYLSPHDPRLCLLLMVPLLLFPVFLHLSHCLRASSLGLMFVLPCS